MESSGSEILNQQYEGFQEQEDLRIAYQKYIQTRQWIATIEEQLLIYDLLWIKASFWEPQTGVAGALEELKKLLGFIVVQGTNALHLAEVWASTDNIGN